MVVCALYSLDGREKKESHVGRGAVVGEHRDNQGNEKGDGVVGKM